MGQSLGLPLCVVGAHSVLCSQGREAIGDEDSTLRSRGDNLSAKLALPVDSQLGRPGHGYVERNDVLLLQVEQVLHSNSGPETNASSPSGTRFSKSRIWFCSAEDPERR